MESQEGVVPAAAGEQGDWLAVSLSWPSLGGREPQVLLVELEEVVRGRDQAPF